MKLCFIGSGIERENTRLDGIEVESIVRVARNRFDTLVFGGSSVGIMEPFARAFLASGGRVISVVPEWLRNEGLLFDADETIFCSNLAERKKRMFQEVDALLCYPGGLGTWDELFDMLAWHAVEPGRRCPPVYLYSWEKFYAPLLLQIETALAAHLIHPEKAVMIRTFETVDAFAKLLKEEKWDDPR